MFNLIKVMQVLLHFKAFIIVQVEVYLILYSHGLLVEVRDIAIRAQ